MLKQKKYLDNEPLADALTVAVKPTCVTDDQCEALDPDHPYCDISGCVECTLALHCPSANPCRDAACIDLACQFTDNVDPCDDGDICSSQDVCGGGSCQPGPDAPNCDDGNLCTDDSCAPASGCVSTNNTVACDDGDACTEQ